MTTVAYLGPAGTFSEAALREAAGETPVEAVPAPTVFDSIRNVADGVVDLALVPFENSIEGSVRATLDALAFDAPEVTILGEHDQSISHALIARRPIDLGAITVVLSHPQPSAQCAHFLRRELPGAELRSAPSTADAVREVAAREEAWGALGSAAAAELYDCVVLRDGVEDEPDNQTRFVWIGRKDAGELRPQSASERWRTTLCFSELGADHPGALVDALREFSSRAVNLTRIESRPLRQGLGRYMFFIDLDGSLGEPGVAESVSALRGKAENVRVLGSYPVERGGVPGG